MGNEEFKGISRFGLGMGIGWFIKPLGGPWRKYSESIRLVEADSTGQGAREVDEVLNA